MTKFENIHNKLKIKIPLKTVKSFIIPERFSMLNLAIKRFENSFNVKFTKKQYVQILNKFKDDEELKRHQRIKSFESENYSILSLSLIKSFNNGGDYSVENLKITPLKIKNNPEINFNDYQEYQNISDYCYFNNLKISVQQLIKYNDVFKLKVIVENMFFDYENLDEFNFFDVLNELYYTNK